MRNRKSIYVAVAAALVVLLAAFVMALAMNGAHRAAAAKPGTVNGHARVAGYGAWTGRKVAGYGVWSGRKVAARTWTGRNVAAIGAWSGRRVASYGAWSGRRVAVGPGGCGALAA